MSIEAPADRALARSVEVSITYGALPHVPVQATALVVPVFEGLKVPSQAGVDLDASFLQANGFTGRLGDVRVLPADDGTSVVCAGAGPRGDVTGETVRRLGAAAARATETHAELAVGGLNQVPGMGIGTAAAAFVEGFGLGAYRFEPYKSAAALRPETRVTIVGTTGKRVADAIRRAAVLVEAVWLARDLVNEPGGVLSPTVFAERAAKAADEAGVGIRVRDEEWIELERLGGLRGVAQGSAEPPRLVELTYLPSQPTGHLVLVGKGVTFDSGGLSLKPGDGMKSMKCDMAGAAAVLGAVTALPRLNSSLAVTAFLPLAENMPGGRALRPGDVVRARNGKTIEVLNTDAEGRLLLADALSLAEEMTPDAIVDIATLTGTQIAALGTGIGAVMGTDQEVVDHIRAAGDETGEAVWSLPLPDEYVEELASPVADLKNIGGKAGTVMAGLFLREFVGSVPWAHLDIAGPAWTEKDAGYCRQGATGFGVRLLCAVVDRLARR